VSAGAGPSAIVAGGGIAGLSAALALKERGWTVTLLEASRRLGGAIETVRRDGFVMETGPDAFITERPGALDLIRSLGLEDDVIGTTPAHRRSFIVFGGRLHRIPEGFYLLAPSSPLALLGTPLLSWAGKCRALADLWLPRGGTGGDESLASFVRRRFGREVLDRLAQPLVAGIYTADPERLSLAATFPRFLELERRHRSVILGLRRTLAARGGAAAAGARYGLFATLRGGLGRIAEAAAARLEGSIYLGEPVARIARAGRRWAVETEAGRRREADALVLALPAPAAARLLAPLDSALAAALAAVPYAGTVTIHVAYDRVKIRHPLDGFGFVVPAVERRGLLACTFSSVKFEGRAPEGAVLLRAFVGGALRPDLVERPDADLVTLVRSELEALIGAEGPPRFTEIRRHPAAMPQYEVGHLDRVAAIRDRVRAHRGLARAGSAYAGIGLPDCAASGRAAAVEVCGLPAGG
jgi:oxygen-dependent protoporphyrinogen oxidase